MRLRKGTFFIVALTVFFSVLTIQVNAASTPFSQGGGYGQGAYQEFADQPTELNWTRHSRFTGVNGNLYEKWKKELGPASLFSPVIAADGTIIVGTKNKYTLLGLNPDGTTKWEYLLTSNLDDSSPVIGQDGYVYFVTDGIIHAVDVETGIERWPSFNLGLGTLGHIALGSDGTLYISSQRKLLIAFDPTTKVIKWQTDIGYYFGQPVIDSNGDIFVRSKSGSTLFVSAISSNGNIKWKKDVLTTSLSDVPRFGAPQLDSQGNLYVVSRPGESLFSIKTSDGTINWSLVLDGEIYSTPALNDGKQVLYVTTTKGLYAINLDGSIKWRGDTGGTGSYNSPLIDAKGDIYINSLNRLLIFNENGERFPIFTVDTSSYQSNNITMDSQGTLYLTNSKGYIYAIGGEAIGTEPTVPPVDPETPVDPEPPVDPVGERAIFVLTLSNGTEKEYDLSMQEVQQFISWYEGRAAGTGPITFAINKHDNNKGPFKQRQDYVVFDKIITFEVNEY